MRNLKYVQLLWDVAVQLGGVHSGGVEVKVGLVTWSPVCVSWAEEMSQEIINVGMTSLSAYVLALPFISPHVQHTLILCSAKDKMFEAGLLGGGATTV